MPDDARWALLDQHLPGGLRATLEERLWRPIEEQATLEALLADESFFADPGRHPAMFADHGVVHVRDVAAALARLVDTVDGVLLASRPPDRHRLVVACGVAQAYLHDVGMVDMTPVGRRLHALHAAHVAFRSDVDELIEHLLGPGPVRSRLDAVAAGEAFKVPRGTVVREILSLAAAHSKTTVPSAVLEDRGALRALMQRILFSDLDVLRAANRTPRADDPMPDPLRGQADHYEDPAAAYAWLAAPRGPQAELADDVIDAVRCLRASDVLRQRGSTLRTSGGYEICFDARTAHAVCTMRTARPDASYLITYDDHRGAGEANIRMAVVTPQGHLRIAFHRGGFAGAEAMDRAAASVADAVHDIASDVIPSFAGVPAPGLPPPCRRAADIRIQLERPDDRPAFADDVAAALVALDPTLHDRVESVADVEGADPVERRRFYAATPIDPGEPLAIEIVERLADHGADTDGIDPRRAFAEVHRVAVTAGEVLVAAGSPPAFVYVPMGPGLVVRPEGGYAPSPLQPWVAVGTTGVIRRAERNAEIVAAEDVEVVMIPADRYTSDWLRPMDPQALRTRLVGSGGASDRTDAR